jgi:hypothetical protein
MMMRLGNRRVPIEPAAIACSNITVYYVSVNGGEVSA